jgi:hypothetical protein
VEGAPDLGASGAGRRAEIEEIGRGLREMVGRGAADRRCGKASRSAPVAGGGGGRLGRRRGAVHRSWGRERARARGEATGGGEEGQGRRQFIFLL